MFRGERFEVDLGEDDEAAQAPGQNTVLPGAFVNDVLERKPAAPKPPTAPTLKNKAGFPEHGARKAESRFKREQKATQTPPTGPRAPAVAQAQNEAISRPGAGGDARSWEEEEKARIDRENNDRLAAMSPDEIEEERRELMNSLSPAMLQKLLHRSNIDSGGAEADLSKQSEPLPESSLKKTAPKEDRPEKKVTFAAQDLTNDPADPPSPIDSPPPEPVPQPASLPAEDSIHFPHASQPPSLDPSSSTFLTDLHAKYFPSLPSDPEKLEWMQPQPPAKPNPYDPSASGLDPKDIRFSFQGALIPPSTASQIPVTAGLHHHGDAPEAAGYTIPELAHLARSSFPAQRCIAFQTLGRILFRLGKGEFGDPGEEQGVVGEEEGLGPLARGLWREMGRGKVTQGLVEESEGRGMDGGRHVSARAYATEAVWLWQRGGGRVVGTD